jgi:hypothetical protein
MLSDLLTLQQSVVISGSDSDYAHSVITILILILDHDPLIIVAVLPAIRADARVVGSEFNRYLPKLVESVINWLSSNDLVRPAALFVSDVVCAMTSLNPDLLKKFVGGLLSRVNCEAFDGRQAILGALGDLARCNEIDCVGWKDRFLNALRVEAQTALAARADTADAKSFAIVCLG